MKKREKEMKGKVYLAGAGPGDAGLLTVKTAELLKTADVIVYDALISAEILSQIPDTAEKINVGKRADHHLVPQARINRILCEKAKEGKTVVRLKGGDPFVFGRGGEELELLVKDGILFEIVPGITSGISVPAYAGIPVTHRDHTSSFHVITGHARKDGVSRIDYEALVRLDATLVFLMGVTALPEICRSLTEAGMDEDMPAAVIQDGTLKSQKKVVSTVKKLPQAAKEAGIEAPAVIVIGRVCALSEAFAWTGKRTLGNMQVLVTRPDKKCSLLARKLRTLGAQVIELPAIRTEPVAEEAEKARIRAELLEMKERIRKPDGKTEWIVFTSAVGAECFFDILEREKLDIRDFWRVRFAVIGEGTRRELLNHGIRADLMPEVYEAQRLGALLAGEIEKGDFVTVLRARHASGELLPPLLEKGAIVRDIPVYDTVLSADTVLREKITALLREKKIDYVTFTSASTVRGFAQMMGGTADAGEEKETGFGELTAQTTALCIGRITEREAKAYGFRTVISEEATIESMITWLTEHGKAKQTC